METPLNLSISFPQAGLNYLGNPPFEEDSQRLEMDL